MLSSKITWEPLRSIDSATFTGSYQRLGTALANPSYILKLVNNSTVLVTISIDGVNDHDIAPANSFWLYDETKLAASGIQFVPVGTQIFVKGAAGTGLVFLVSQFIQQG